MDLFFIISGMVWGSICGAHLLGRRWWKEMLFGGLLITGALTVLILLYEFKGMRDAGLAAAMFIQGSLFVWFWSGAVVYVVNLATRRHRRPANPIHG